MIKHSRLAPRDALIQGLCGGSAIAYLATAIRQDVLGLEGSIAALREHWWPSHITAPIEAVSLVMLTVGLWVSFRLTRGES